MTTSPGLPVKLKHNTDVYGQEWCHPQVFNMQAAVLRTRVLTGSGDGRAGI